MNEELKIIISAEISDLKKATNDAKKQVKGMADESGKSVDKLVSSLAKIGKAVAASFTVKAIADFTKEIVNCSAAVAAEESAFAQIMGDYSDTATQKLRGVADETGIAETRMTAAMTSMTAKWSGLGYGIEDATTLASEGLTLAADASAFWDMSLDESVSHLNSFINGSYEGGEAIGLFANDTQMALYAVEQGLIADTKAWSSLDEATKQATRLEYAQSMMEASGAIGQAAKEADSYANVQANLTEKWRQFKALIGEPILQNIVIPAMEALIGVVDSVSAAYQNMNVLISGVRDTIQSISEWCVQHQTTLLLIGIAIGTVTAALIAYNAAAIAKTVVDAAETVAIYALIAAETAHTVASTIATAATTAFGAAMAFLTSPITLVIVAIGLLVAAIVLCVKHWDEISAKVQEVWTKIQEFTSQAVEAVKAKFEQMKQAISEKVSAIREAVINKFNEVKTGIQEKVSNAKQAVVDGFNNMKSSATEKVSSIASSVKNKFNEIKTGITNAINGARDAVNSAITKIKSIMNFSWSLPHLKLPRISISGKFSINPPSAPKFSISWNKLGGVFNKPTLFNYGGSLQGIGEDGAEAVVPLEKNTKWLDRLATMLNEKQGGGRPIIMQVDGKTFAQVSVDSINALTRQTGNLPLKLA